MLLKNVKKDILGYWITFIVTYDFASDPCAVSYWVNWTWPCMSSDDWTQSKETKQCDLCHQVLVPAWFQLSLLLLKYSCDHSSFHLCTHMGEKRERRVTWMMQREIHWDSSFQKEIRVYSILLSSKVFIFTVNTFGEGQNLKNCSEERSNLKAILWVIYCFVVFSLLRWKDGIFCLSGVLCFFLLPRWVFVAAHGLGLLVAALGGFSSCGTRVLGFVGSVLGAHRLSSCGMRA